MRLAAVARWVAVSLRWVADFVRWVAVSVRWVADFVGWVAVIVRWVAMFARVHRMNAEGHSVEFFIPIEFLNTESPTLRNLQDVRTIRIVL